ncbi:MAG TPA: carbohydrate kinase family protein [Patescibacteria group bacterium]|nr:carbohydrate kinase family protein [Patescibacteria group bacterium]
MNKIICIGSACKDMFFPTREGVVTETPEDLMSQKKITFELGAKYKIEKRYEALGGVAANVASGLAKLGLQAACYSNTGDDYISNWTKEQLKKNSVDISLITSSPNTSGDFSAIIVDKNSAERVIFTNQPANSKLEIYPEKLKNSEWLLLGDLHGDWEADLDKIIVAAKENNIKVAMNPRQVNIHDNPQKVLEIIAKCNNIFLNKDEAMEVLNASREKYSPEDLNNESFLIKKILESGPEVVAITDGVRGAWAGKRDKIFHTEIIKVNAVETTGAGDAFCSGFMAAYLKDKELEECLKWGIANSCKSVECYGSIDGLLDENEIVKLAGDIIVEEIN